MDHALEALVRRRAGGRCEYCHFPRPPFHIEHIIARKHSGPTVKSNLALACMRCNLHKGTNLAGIDRATGNVIQLFNPRRENWRSHFRWEGAKLIGLTQTGRVTIDVLNINDPLRIAARETLIKAGAFRPQ